jgi:hypothetical protein
LMLSRHVFFRCGQMPKIEKERKISHVGRRVPPVNSGYHPSDILTRAALTDGYRSGDGRAPRWSIQRDTADMVPGASVGASVVTRPTGEKGHPGVVISPQLFGR